MIAVAIPLTWLNERKDVKIDNMVSKGKKNVVDGVDSSAPTADNNMKLVQTCGQLTVP